MIRKPATDWQREESPLVDHVRAAKALAREGARTARRGGSGILGLICYFFAIMWGFAALAGGLFMGSLANFIGIGAMAAFMAWAGNRAFARARRG